MRGVCGEKTQAVWRHDDLIVVRENQKSPRHVRRAKRGAGEGRHARHVMCGQLAEQDHVLTQRSVGIGEDVHRPGFRHVKKQNR